MKKRTVGKYVIKCTSSDVTYDNFYMFDVWVNKVHISKRELWFDAAHTLRYSEHPQEIADILDLLITGRENSVKELKELINE